MTEKDRRPGKGPGQGEPRDKPKEKPGEGFEHRPEPKGLEIEEADRRGYGQDR